MTSYNNIHSYTDNFSSYINLEFKEFHEIRKISKKTQKIPGEKVFSRICAIKHNSYGGDIETFIKDYQRKYDSTPQFSLKNYPRYDPDNYFHSSQIFYRLLQTGFKKGSHYEHSKQNTYFLCPFCELKSKTSRKEHRVEIVTADDKLKEVDGNVEGFYDTGKSAFCHHLAECHGVLKKSIMPQPFIGFSKSLNMGKVYELSLVCPHQHWNDGGELVGCNTILPYNIGKKYDVDIPFKAYFRHFYKYHVSEPKDEDELTLRERLLQREVIQKKLNKVAQLDKHVQTPDNIFIPLSYEALQETIRYQQLNANASGEWYPTLQTVGIADIKSISSYCVDPNYKHTQATHKRDIPVITHVADFRSKDTSPTNRASSPLSPSSPSPTRRPFTTIKSSDSKNRKSSDKVKKPKRGPKIIPLFSNTSDSSRFQDEYNKFLASAAYQSSVNDGLNDFEVEARDTTEAFIKSLTIPQTRFHTGIIQDGLTMNTLNTGYTNGTINGYDLYNNQSNEYNDNNEFNDIKEEYNHAVIDGSGKHMFDVFDEWLNRD